MLLAINPIDNAVASAAVAYPETLLTHLHEVLCLVLPLLEVKVDQLSIHTNLLQVPAV